jgi:hypothetical protein
VAFVHEQPRGQKHQDRHATQRPSQSWSQHAAGGALGRLIGGGVIHRSVVGARWQSRDGRLITQGTRTKGDLNARGHLPGQARPQCCTRASRTWVKYVEAAGGGGHTGGDVSPTSPGKVLLHAIKGRASGTYAVGVARSGHDDDSTTWTQAQAKVSVRVQGRSGASHRVASHRAGSSSQNK